MSEGSIAFKFQHIPRNIDKSSIKTFINTKGFYSLEYAIIDPQDVFINMHAIAIVYLQDGVTFTQTCYYLLDSTNFF